MNTSKLMLEIARCPNINKCFKTEYKNHPCSDIVASQNVDREQFQLPEPWNGDIEKAKILFISSNPSINRSETYPSLAWPDDKIEEYFRNRFEGRWVKVHNNRYYPSLTDGTYARANNFWGKVRNHAITLLQRNAVAGIDYAITEVVHCKSIQEIGVSKALVECSKYLSRIISVSNSRVIVVIGKKAHKMVQQELNYMSDITSRFEKIDNRYWIFVDHSYTKKVLIENVLSTEELKLVRNFIQ